MFAVFFLHLSPLHQTIEKLKGNYERAQRELSECRHQLQHLQSKHRDVLADIEAHRSVSACSSPPLREL